MDAVVKTHSFQEVTAEGKKRQVSVRATVVGASTKNVVRKASDSVFTQPSSKGDVEHNQALGAQYNTIPPPFELYNLACMADVSTELRQDIQTMVQNTVGFGWQLREIPMLPELREQYAAQIDAERYRLMARLKNVHPLESLTSLRKKEHHDKQSTGNGYLELVEGLTGDLVGLNHVPGHAIRLTAKDECATPVVVESVRPDLGFSVERSTMYVRFRKFLMEVDHQKAVFFKEAGDPRYMDAYTGEYSDFPIPLDRRATSLIHNKIYHPTTPYGVPVWIGTTIGVRGSREADELNYNTMAHNAIPSAFIIVENGSLTEGSIERLKEFTEEQLQNDSNYSKFIILEGEVTEEGSPNPSQFRIRVEPMKRLQQTDEMFQQYDANNRTKTRQSFRIPPIFAGMVEEYSRSSADAARSLADEQVFAPERETTDEQINRFVLSRWGAKFHTFRSNNPNITDDTELVRLMGIAERSGAMTPRRADRIIRDVFGDSVGPLPVGIDLDKPFSITFAEAQQKGGLVQNTGQQNHFNPEKGIDPASAIDSLIQMRSEVEKEIDRRASEKGGR